MAGFIQFSHSLHSHCTDARRKYIIALCRFHLTWFRATGPHLHRRFLTWTTRAFQLLFRNLIPTPSHRVHITVNNLPDTEAAMSPRPQYHLWPAVARNGSSSAQSNSSDRTVVASTTAPSIEPSAARPRNASTTPLVAPTDPNSIRTLPVSRWSISTRTSFIQGRAEKPTTTPPSKSNNYWGFCSGAWTIRADAQKGLALRVIPSGLWNMQEVWECRCCSFRGSAFVLAKHGREKEKGSTIVDPRILVSGCGVRYRWICKALHC
jgi:hypothetical protein